MGNCGSFPKTKGDEAVAAPVEESVKVKTVDVEEKEVTITNVEDDQGKKESDDCDDKKEQSLQTLLTSDEVVEKKETSEEQVVEKKVEEALPTQVKEDIDVETTKPEVSTTEEKEKSTTSDPKAPESATTTQ